MLLCIHSVYDDYCEDCKLMLYSVSQLTAHTVQGLSRKDGFGDGIGRYTVAEAGVNFLV